MCLSPSEDGFCSSETKHNRRTETKVTNPKTVQSTILGEDVGFRDNFFYGIQQYISNDEAYGKLLGNKD
jgi:hypothetical protein